MVAGDGGIGFGGDCWLCGFDRGKEKEMEERDGREERSELFILFDRIVYIILINCMSK